MPDIAASASARSSASTLRLAGSSMVRLNSTVTALSPLGSRRGGGRASDKTSKTFAWDMHAVAGFATSGNWVESKISHYFYKLRPYCAIRRHYRSADTPSCNGLRCHLTRGPRTARCGCLHTLPLEPKPKMSLSPDAIATLSTITTATITTVLLKKGLRNVWMRGARPLRPGLPRLVGPAFPLRFVPAREDLATPESWSSPISTRTAIEAMPAGCIAVVDAMGVSDAGIFGDILCARMMKRGVTALITDGVVRDLEGVLGTGLPVWCDGYAAPPSVAGLTFVGWGEPIGCGGVAVFPDDIIVADQDGAVLIPKAQLEHVLNEGVEQERMEAWIGN